MSNDPQPTPPATQELLQRILNAVEPPKRRRGLEVLCAQEVGARGQEQDRDA